MNRRGRFITLEGIDGSGKSTQAGRLAKRLEARGLKVVRTREPGGTALGREIRRLLLDGRHAPVAEAELLLFLADRAQHVRTLVAPALAEGAWVLCDRYSDSTLAYQAAARGLGAIDEVRELIGFAECGCRPDLTLWFDLPVEQARSRMRARTDAGTVPSRLDSESLAFHRRVAEAFADLARAEPDRIVRIDAEADEDAVERCAWAALTRAFPELST